jgi:hypothetical protein
MHMIRFFEVGVGGSDSCSSRDKGCLCLAFNLAFVGAFVSVMALLQAHVAGYVCSVLEPFALWLPGIGIE